MTTKLKIGPILFLLGFTASLVGFMSPAAGAAEPAYNANLKAAHVGSENPGFETGSCPSEGYGWHFILPGNITTFVAVKATFQTAGVITTFESFPSGKHAYVYTPGPDTLLAATAEVSGPKRVFNLSHVCTGPTTTTTSTTAPTTTSTTAPTTTSTTAPTTTSTTAPSTTSPGPTSTTAPSTTSPGPTSTPPEPSTTPPALAENTAVPPSTEVPVSVAEAVVVLDEATVAPARPRTVSLARTGSQSRSLFGIGLMLVITGSLMMVLDRRRRGIA